MHQHRRTSLFEATVPLCVEEASRQHNSKASKNKVSLRRCKSNPEKKLREEASLQEWQRAWDQKRGYVTDLIAELPPTSVQPQLSYFAYLGNNDPRKRGYQRTAIKEDTQTVVNLGNAIYFQNGPKALSRPANTLPEVMELPRNTIREPIKTDNTELSECCTCICCVKALFYHCTKDHELEGDWGTEPCACEGPGVECVSRWGVLGVLSLFLPCLLCYPVLNGCRKCCFYFSNNSRDA